MERINVILPAKTLEALDSHLKSHGRSQFLNYAALALLARLRGGHMAALEAIGYEGAAKALLAVVAGQPGSSQPGSITRKGK